MMMLVLFSIMIPLTPSPFRHSIIMKLRWIDTYKAVILPAGQRHDHFLFQSFVDIDNSCWNRPGWTGRGVSDLSSDCDAGEHPHHYQRRAGDVHGPVERLYVASSAARSDKLKMLQVALADFQLNGTMWAELFAELPFHGDPGDSGPFQKYYIRESLRPEPRDSAVLKRR